MAEYNIPVGLGMLAVGIFLCLWGVSLMKVAIFLAVAVSVFGLVSSASFSVYDFFTGGKE